MGVDNIDKLTDIVVSELPVSYNKKIKYLYEINPIQRMRKLIEDLQKEIDKNPSIQVTDDYKQIAEKYQEIVDNSKNINEAIDILTRSPKQLEVFNKFLELSSHHQQVTREELMNETHCNSSVIRNLVVRQIFTLYDAEVGRLNNNSTPHFEKINPLSPAQQEVFDAISNFKNEEATHEAIDEKGYYHTGDLGTMSASGHIFIRGRIKNMLLGANGQNVYPEEIEDKLNTMAMVSESIVIQRGDKLVALVHPDKDDMMSFSEDELQHIMEQNRQDLNNQLPVYSRISAIELHEEEFAKTPKKSIKRYLYQNT